MHDIIETDIDIDITKFDITPQTKRLHAAPTKPSTHRLIGFIILSVLGHLLIVAALIIAKTTIPSPALTQLPALQSYLMFTQTKREAPDTRPILSDAMPHLADKKTRNANLSDIEPSIDIKASDPANSALIISDTSKTQSNEKTPLSKSTQIIKRRLDNAVRNYQSLLDSSAIRQMSEQQANEYQARKLSPILTQTEMLSSEQREAILRRVEVDCSNAAKQGLSMISGLMGGTIECRSAQDIQQYINKRLNKDTEPVNHK